MNVTRTFYEGLTDLGPINYKTMDSKVSSNKCPGIWNLQANHGHGRTDLTAWRQHRRTWTETQTSKAISRADVIKRHLGIPIDTNRRLILISFEQQQNTREMGPYLLSRPLAAVYILQRFLWLSYYPPPSLSANKIVPTTFGRRVAL